MAPGDVATDKEGNIIAKLIPVRYRQDFEKVPPHQVDYVQLSPVQVISVATSLIPVSYTHLTLPTSDLV